MVHKPGRLEQTGVCRDERSCPRTTQHASRGSAQRAIGTVHAVKRPQERHRRDRALVGVSGTFGPLRRELTDQDGVGRAAGAEPLKRRGIILEWGSGAIARHSTVTRILCTPRCRSSSSVPTTVAVEAYTRWLSSWNIDSSERCLAPEAAGPTVMIMITSAVATI